MGAQRRKREFSSVSGPVRTEKKKRKNDNGDHRDSGGTSDVGSTVSGDIGKLYNKKKRD